MNEFVYSYPTKVYFGKKTAVNALAKELAGTPVPPANATLCPRRRQRETQRGSYQTSHGHPEERRQECVVEFGGIMPNPTYAKVQEGARLAKEQGVEFVLALGGGSVVDCCKIDLLSRR